MDSWEEGFDVWTPPAAQAPGEATDTGTDLNRDELLRLARELAGRRHAEQEHARTQLRERAAAVAVRERELEELQRRLEGQRHRGRGRLEELRAKRATPQKAAAP